MSKFNYTFHFLATHSLAILSLSLPILYYDILKSLEDTFDEIYEEDLFVYNLTTINMRGCVLVKFSTNLIANQTIVI